MSGTGTEPDEARSAGGRRREAAVLVALGIGLAAAAVPARAQTDPRGAEIPETQPADPVASGQPAQQGEQPSIADILPPRLADPGGVRAALARAGVTYSLTFIGDLLTNTSGGIRRGGAGQERLDLQLDADLGKLVGLDGFALHANVYQIGGQGLSTCCLGNLLVASGIEAQPALRLFELWLEGKVLDGLVSVRAGQLAADTEFLVSQYGGLFVNATFGWPAGIAAALPNGGPAYPTATPGVRLRLAPNDKMSLSVVLFNGDPVGPNGPSPPQRRDHSGFEFRTSDPALILAEGSLAYGAPDGGGLLPGTIKLGGWHHLGRFADARFGPDGLSLADPASVGFARLLRGNQGVYAVIDQLVYRLPDAPDRGIGIFGRVTASPGDRNLISFYGDGGVTFKGLVPGRPNDTFGFGFGYAAISGANRALDRELLAAGFAAGLDPATGLSAGPRLPVRSSEAVLEATYQAVLAPGITLQPDLQYVIRPGAGASNPRDPAGRPAGNATVLGLRAIVRY